MCSIEPFITDLTMDKVTDDLELDELYGIHRDEELPLPDPVEVKRIKRQKAYHMFKDKREIIDIIKHTNLTPNEIVEAYLYHKM